MPRARGTVDLSIHASGSLSRLQGLRQSGSLRCLFPRPSSAAVEAVLVNTAGGIAGGDKFSVSAETRANSTLTLTSQAAERAYKARGFETGHMTTQLNVADNARINWLPQETILFEGCNFRRSLRLDLAASGSALIVEPLVFGRTEMGETLADIRFRDRIDIRQDGTPLFLDAITLEGDVQKLLDRPHIASSSRAIASLVYVANDAETWLAPVRKLLPAQGGASLLKPNVMVMRMLAADSFELRKHLIPILNLLTHQHLPKCWMI